MTDTDIKQVIAVRRDLNMRRDKLASQVANAAMMFLVENDEADRSDELSVKLSFAEATWLNGNRNSDVVGVDSEDELRDLMLRAQLNDIECHPVTNVADDTESTLTCVAFGPCEANVLDSLTGSLRHI